MSILPSRPVRSRILTLRLTRGELAILRGRAHTAGMPVSTYLRARAVSHRMRIHPGSLDRSDLDLLVRLGQNLNSLAHAANASSRILNPRELTLLLVRIRDLLARVRYRLGA